MRESCIHIDALIHLELLFFSISQTVSTLEDRVQVSLGEVRRLTLEMETTARKNDEIVRGLQNDNKNLKEVNEVCRTQLQEVVL